MKLPKFPQIPAEYSIVPKGLATGMFIATSATWFLWIGCVAVATLNDRQSALEGEQVLASIALGIVWSTLLGLSAKFSRVRDSFFAAGALCLCFSLLWMCSEIASAFYICRLGNSADDCAGP